MSILDKKTTITINEKEKQLLMAGLLHVRKNAKYNLDYDTQLSADQLHTKISNTK